MTDPLIDLNDHITLNLNGDDGIKVGIVPADGGIATCLVVRTDLGNFVVGLGRQDIKTIFFAIKNIIDLTPEQYQHYYGQLRGIADQEGIK